MAFSIDRPSIGRNEQGAVVDGIAMAFGKTGDDGQCVSTRYRREAFGKLSVGRLREERQIGSGAVADEPELGRYQETGSAGRGIGGRPVDPFEICGRIGRTGVHL